MNQIRIINQSNINTVVTVLSLFSKSYFLYSVMSDLVSNFDEYRECRESNFISGILVSFLIGCIYENLTSPYRTKTEVTVINCFYLVQFFMFIKYIYEIEIYCQNLVDSGIYYGLTIGISSSCVHYGIVIYDYLKKKTY